MKFSSICAAIILAALCAPQRGWAQDGDLIHSDTPLWAPGAEDVWPRFFSDNEEFGCAQPMRMGDWRYSAAGDDPDDATWYRFSNYGVHHCWLNVGEADDREDLKATRPAFLIKLGRAKNGADLWVLQLGARPGSDYLLLAYRPIAGGRSRFDVLQRECPHGNIRRTAPLDILLTDYCSINTRLELVALAQRMAERPPLGALTFEQRLPDD